MSVQELQQQVDALTQQLAEAKKSRVVVTRERKLQKLAGRPKTSTDVEVSDWLIDIRQHIADLDETQKLDIIMGHITGGVREEVRLRAEAERDTAEKIFKIIEDNFKEVDSLASLNKKFFNRTQEAKESVQSFSRALMKFNSRIQQKGGTALDDKTLNLKLIDGLSDSSLKRELRRLDKEDEALTFTAFRQRVLEIVADDECDVEVAKDREVKVNPESEMVALLKQSMELQKQTLEELKKHNSGATSKPPPAAKSSDASKATTPAENPRFPPSPYGPCYICGKSGHTAYRCYFNKKNKRDKSKDAKPAEN